MELSEEIDFPKELVKEVEKFKERNFFSIPSSQEKAYCTSCLKAFAISKAKEMNLGNEIISNLEKKIDSDKGHSGYYQDRDVIIKIED